MKNTLKIKMLVAGMALAALAAIAVEIVSYVAANKELSRSNRDLQLSEKMADASQAHQLVVYLSNGMAENARQILNQKIVGDMSSIKTMVVSAGAKQKNVAQGLATRIAAQDSHLAAVRPHCVDQD